MDRMPLDLLKPATSARELINLPKPPAACPMHPPVMREEGERHSFFEHAGSATMTCTLQATPPDNAVRGPIGHYEVASRALAEMVNQARDSYFRHAPPAEREEYEANLRNTRALMTGTVERVDDAVNESIARLNQARDAYFRNAPQSERDQHEQSMQQVRSMSNADIVAYCNARKAEYLLNG